MDQLEQQFDSTGFDDSAFAAPDIGPQEQAEHLANLVAKTLEDTDLVDIVEVQASLGQIHVLGRVRQDNERPLVHGVVKNILLRCNDIKCDPHIGKIFFLKNKRLVYGWIFSFASDDLFTAAQAICEAVFEIIPRKEVLESPLLGPSTPQSDGVSKGARPIGGA